MIRRRRFLKLLALTPAALAVQAQDRTPQAAGVPYKEARYYQQVDGRKGIVACMLCPRSCVIGDGETGFCRARKNIKGTLYALGYGQPCAIHIDPIEKKPFFNVLPRTLSFSIASAGCNLRCKFCQNWQISQISPLESKNHAAPPDRIVALARSNKCRSIAYTYTEPSNFYEYMFDTARLAKAQGILNVSHSNGYINPEPLKALAAHMHAVNIDLKGFSEAFYASLCEARLAPVMETIKILKKSGVWVEITNLVIPGHNDDPAMITGMCEWIRGDVGPDVPIHFSRFFPLYRMTTVPPTPVKTLERARDIAIRAGLRYAYIGNVPGHPGEHTYCPKCGKMVIKRSGYNILENYVKTGRCEYCNERIGGIWQA